MLNADHLFIQYEGAEAYAVQDMTFHIEAGERVAIMGPNGAGKSSLLLALTGVLPVVSGSVQAGGIKMEKKNIQRLRQKVGMLFQNPDDQLFMPTVYDDIAFGPRRQGAPETETAAKAGQVMESLGILHLKNRLSHQLSGGEKRLAALAGLLVTEPAVLLMDEPTAFLDPRASRRLAEILRGLPQALLIATHDSAWAQAVCRRIILMKDGQLLADGPASDILKDTELLLSCGL